MIIHSSFVFWTEWMASRAIITPWKIDLPNTYPIFSLDMMIGNKFLSLFIRTLAKTCSKKIILKIGIQSPHFLLFNTKFRARIFHNMWFCSPYLSTIWGEFFVGGDSPRLGSRPPPWLITISCRDSKFKPKLQRMIYSSR